VIAHIKEWTKLKRLSLDATKVRAEGLAVVAKMPELEFLALNRVKAA